jgi:hypothetical protein
VFVFFIVGAICVSEAARHPAALTTFIGPGTWQHLGQRSGKEYMHECGLDYAISSVQNRTILVAQLVTCQNMPNIINLYGDVLLTVMPNAAVQSGSKKGAWLHCKLWQVSDMQPVALPNPMQVIYTGMLLSCEERVCCSRRCAMFAAKGHAIRCMVGTLPE